MATGRPLSHLISDFVGRTDELGALALLLARHRLVTVTGAGGSGKTRLAYAVAAKEPAVAVAELAELGRDEQVPDAVAWAVTGRSGPLETVVPVIAGQSLLLVVDNCEHVLAGAAEVVQALLGRCPELRVLCTSRRVLDLAGEVAWRTPPMSASDGRALFMQRAAAAGWGPAPADGPAIDEICARLDGMPLAIELAATRTRVLSPAEIAASLSARLDLLSAGYRLAPARQQTLRASIAWSYALLSPPAQLLLPRLAVFVGGWTLAAAERVAAPLGRPLLDVLQELADHSLVNVQLAGGSRRFGMLESIRQFALEQLPPPDLATARSCHAAWFAELAEAAGMNARLDRDARRRLQGDEANLRAAAEHLITMGSGQALPLVLTLAEFWLATGRPLAAQQLLASAAGIGGDTICRARVLAIAGMAGFFCSDYEHAVASAEAAVEVGERLGDAEAPARGRLVLTLLRGVNNTAAGHALLDQAEAALLNGGRRDLRLDVRWLRAFLYAMEDRYDALGPALESWRSELGPDPPGWSESLYHYYRSWHSAAAGRYRQAVSDLNRALAADPDGRIGALAQGDLALDAVRRGDLVEARRRTELARAAGERVGAATALRRLRTAEAWIMLQNGRPAHAQEHMAEIWRLEEDRGMAHGTASMLQIEGLAAIALDDTGTAIDAARALEEVAARRLGANPRFTAQAHLILARAHWDADSGTATRHAHEALLIAREGGIARLTEDALELLGAFSLLGGDLPRGRRLIAAVRGARAADGRCRVPTDAEFWAQVDRHSGAFMADGPGDDPAVTPGHPPSLAETVAYARRGRGPHPQSDRGWESLTPTEARVAELAVTGLTNGQIAQELFMSANTVKLHLSRVYGKLDVSGRVGLTSAHAAKNTTKSHPSTGE